MGSPPPLSNRPAPTPLTPKATWPPPSRSPPLHATHAALSPRARAAVQPVHASRRGARARKPPYAAHAPAACTTRWTSATVAGAPRKSLSLAWREKVKCVEQSSWPRSHVTREKADDSSGRSGATCSVPLREPESVISTKVVTREGTLIIAANRARKRMKRELDLNVGMLIQQAHEPSASCTTSPQAPCTSGVRASHVSTASLAIEKGRYSCSMPTSTRLALPYGNISLRWSTKRGRVFLTCLRTSSRRAATGALGLHPRSRRCRTSRKSTSLPLTA
mmetsp:Transcript_4265/g.11324  ORF Transcript_4265/g.11324 Transcript_4265/m.11324 type:complete len:277 (-) Transcript_4265:1412-2242(-)